jgi:hypothetical protein
MTQWEYLMINWTENRQFTSREADFATRQKLRTANIEETKWEQVLSIMRPGAKEREVLGKRISAWRTGMGVDHEVIQEIDTSVFSVLNELGSEGWELVSTTVMSSAVISPANGYPTGGHPVDIRYYLKRPVPD